MITNNILEIEDNYHFAKKSAKFGKFHYFVLIFRNPICAFLEAILPSRIKVHFSNVDTKGKFST